MALCNGEIYKDSGTLIHNLTRYDDKKKIIEKAITHYKVLDTNVSCSLVELKPITGRKHQIRKQLLEIGHPIIGDQKYNLQKFKNSSNKNLMLHAYKIKFIINNDKLNFKANVPNYFIKYVNAKKINFLDS